LFPRSRYSRLNELTVQLSKQYCLLCLVEFLIIMVFYFNFYSNLCILLAWRFVVFFSQQWWHFATDIDDLGVVGGPFCDFYLNRWLLYRKRYLIFCFHVQIQSLSQGKLETHFYLKLGREVAKSSKRLVVAPTTSPDVCDLFW